MKNPENMNDQYNERERLETALRLNQPLATVYYMKEDLRRFWHQPDKAQAEICIIDWIRRALVSGFTMLAKFARLLGAYRTGILNYNGCLSRPGRWKESITRSKR